MCLIAFAWNAHPRFPLVLAANRDEFHARPTAALAAWDDVPGAYGGRDLREGGSWLALHESGRLAAVTNVREPKLHAAPRSRGHLVRDFVANGECAVGCAEHMRVSAPDYGAFNLLLWDRRELVFASNRPEPHWNSVPRGVYGISNGGFDPRAKREWPKVSGTSGALRDWLNHVPDAPPAELDFAGLFAALADERHAPDLDLPDTGVGIEMERLLSPPFIRGSAYGTRAGTVVAIDRDGSAVFVERRFGPDGVVLGETRLALKLRGAR